MKSSSVSFLASLLALSSVVRCAYSSPAATSLTTAISPGVNPSATFPTSFFQASQSYSAQTTSSGTPIYAPSALPNITSAADPSKTAIAACESSLNGVLPTATPADFTFSGTVRRYYVAAEQVTWNYAPTGWDNWLGVPIDESPFAYDTGYLKSAGSFGLEWQKAQYKGYTDSSFTTLTEQPDTLGLNGPVLRAEVGDMVEILFLNRLSRNYAGIHSMGLAYNKANEGSLYPDVLGPGTSSYAQPGAAVAPGDCFVYKWLISNATAPDPGARSHMWAYHPFVNMRQDLSAGLAGPFIVYGAGMMNETMASYRENILRYQNFQEQASWLDAENAARYGGNMSIEGYDSSRPTPRMNAGYGNESIWVPQMVNTHQIQLSSTQAPTFYALNGHVFANQPPFQMCQDDKVIWYVYAYGGASHVFHLHGNNFHVDGEEPGSERAVVSINDGAMFTLQMKASAPGVWGVICHVSNHEANGMQDNYVVYPKDACPLPRLAS